jgi:lipoate---protein ligase
VKHRFRLLETGSDRAFHNMGLDEAILKSVATGTSIPTLRLYGWKPEAISLGYFQGARDEVDVEACFREGVDIVRRITGGGAVFHAAEVTYSIVVPEGHRLAPSSILDSYALICAGIVQGLKSLGAIAEFAPINDIVCGGRKVSGNAQTRKLGCLLQHGTILLDVDVDRMFSLLRVPKEKSSGRLISEAKARVTSLSAVLGRAIGFEECSKALAEGFATALDLDLEPETPSAGELALAESLAADKFSTDSWTFRR